MQFIQTPNWFKVIRVTGPSHNILAIRFSPNCSEDEIIVEAMSFNHEESQTPIDAYEVKINAIAGVKEANTALSTSFHISHIRYVLTDSPPASIYRSLARSIIERLVAKEPFVEDPND